MRTIGGTAIDGESVTKSQRPLLAALVLTRGQGATIDTLVDAVWPRSAPTSAKQSIQNQVSRLRSSFGVDLIATCADRYVLHCTADVDRIDRVTSLCDRTSMTGAEADAVAEVLADWRGDPYADLPEHPGAQAERARLWLVQGRLIETLALARLTDPWGDRYTAIAELTVRTTTEPLHEQAWELLVVALHLVGRRTDALREYLRFAEALDRQLSAAPSRRFQRIRELVVADDYVDPADVFSRADVGTALSTRLLATA